MTDSKGAETYKRIPIHPGNIILGDRGYCHREGVAHVLRQNGDVIVRLNSTSFPLIEAASQADFEILSHLHALPGHQAGEWPVRFRAAGRLWSARLCAVRKSQHAAERAKLKLLQQTSRRQTQVRPETLEFAVAKTTRGPVATAKRSTAAQAKAATHTLDDGTPAHSFATLQHELATIVRNTCRAPQVPDGAPTFKITHHHSEPKAASRPRTPRRHSFVDRTLQT